MQDQDDQIVCNVVGEIITKSQEKPKENMHWLSKLFNFILLPLKIIRLGDALFDKRQNEKLEMCDDNSIVRKNISFSTRSYTRCNMRLALHNTDTQVTDRKLVIVISPASPCTNLQWDGEPDICHVFRPLKPIRQGKKYTDAAVSAIGRMLNAGYKPENISIVGFCAGAAVAIHAINKAHKVFLNNDENKKFAQYASLNAAKDLYAICERSENIDMKDGNDWIINNIKKWPTLSKFIIWLSGNSISVNKEDIQKLPVQDIVIQNNKQDDVVPIQHSIAKLTKELAEDDKRIRIKMTYSSDAEHKEPICTLHKRNSIAWGTKMQEKNKEDKVDKIIG